MRAALLAGIFALLAAFVTGTFQLASTTQAKGELVLVDASFEGNTNTLDLLVTNRGDKVAVIKRCVVSVKDVIALRTVTGYRAKILRSGEYDFQISPAENPQVLTMGLAHSVKPNEVERIALRFSISTTDPETAEHDYIAIFTVALQYDELDRSVVTKQVLLAHFNGVQRYLKEVIVPPFAFSLGGVFSANELQAAPGIDFSRGDVMTLQAQQQQEYFNQLGKKTANRNIELISTLRDLDSIQNQEVNRRLEQLQRDSKEFLAFLTRYTEPK